jgi:hypothetical protein
MDASTRNGRLVAALVAGAALLVAGCSSSTPSAGSAARRTESRYVPAATSAPATSALPASCKNSDLSILLGPARTAGGTTDYQIEFINISGALCTLYGYPGVSFVSGRTYSIPVGSAATRSHSSPEDLVLLSPEGTATAVISVENVKDLSGGCGQTTISAIVIHAPSSANAVRLPFTGQTCVNPRYHMLSVGPVVHGSLATGGD